MGITTFGYFVSIALGVLIFYLLPLRARWPWLLVLSFLYVLSVNLFGLFFILATSLTAYLLARKLEVAKENKKRLVITGVTACAAVLILLKYAVALPWVCELQIGSFGIYLPNFVHKYLYPVGLSYYTLQIISYLLDVYWERQKAEKNYFKVLLFTCYFPQLVQGPISKYGELAPELFKAHRFEWQNLKFGVQLVLWGLFKKLVIADRIGGWVHNIFHGDTTPYGFTIWFGLVYFGIQLYCDFSGGIDIIRGFSQCFGIGLKDNFRQPYFSRSLGEFWRRWHISLGEWMKDYVFYPISMSQSLNSVKKSLKKVTSRKMANRIGMGIADILVFMLVGIWHGTGTNFFAWGLYNGIILAISAILVDQYADWKRALKINEEALWWKSFQLVRTFSIVTIGWIFDCATTASGSWTLFVNMWKFQSFSLSQIYSTFGIAFILATSIGLLFLTSVLHERGLRLRPVIGKTPYWVQLIVWSILLHLILGWGYVAPAGGFMYANF